MVATHWHIRNMNNTSLLLFLQHAWLLGSLDPTQGHWGEQGGWLTTLIAQKHMARNLGSKEHWKAEGQKQKKQRQVAKCCLC